MGGRRLKPPKFLKQLVDEKIKKVDDSSSSVAFVGLKQISKHYRC